MGNNIAEDRAKEIEAVIKESRWKGRRGQPGHAKLVAQLKAAHEQATIIEDASRTATPSGRKAHGAATAPLEYQSCSITEHDAT